MRDYGEMGGCAGVVRWGTFIANVIIFVSIFLDFIIPYANYK